MTGHSQAYRARRKAAPVKLVTDARHRNIEPQLPLNSDQRNASAHQSPHHWDKQGNRLMEAGGTWARWDGAAQDDSRFRTQLALKLNEPRLFPLPSAYVRRREW